MCGLFIKRLINLTEEKIKENPFFFFIHSFSYRSIRSRFQISNSYLYLSQENPLNILAYRLQSVLGVSDSKSYKQNSTKVKVIPFIAIYLSRV